MLRGNMKWSDKKVMCAYRGETPALVVGYSFIQSFNKDLLSTNYVPGSVFAI